MNGLRRTLPTIVGLLTLAFASTAGAAQLTPIATSAQWGTKPIHVASPPGDPRLFVAESGRVNNCGGSGGPTTGTAALRVVSAGSLLPTPYLSLTVSCEGERGLSAVAFAPDFASSGKLYLYVAAGGEMRVVEYTVPDPAADTAGAATSRTVLAMTDNSAYHNGGQLMFGPDGKLYVTTGDDNDGPSAQSGASPNGKILQVNPAGTNDYGIFASGLRNPFRASFDPAGRLIAADVGQSAREEIDIITAGGNYGWPLCEGDLPYSGSCAGFAPPAHTYGHDATHKSIIGGHVARDTTLTGLTGCYVYGDLASKNIDMIEIGRVGATAVPSGLAIQNAYSLWSFGEDSSGRLYVVADGTVYRVDAGGTAPATCIAPPGPAAPSLQISSKRLNLDRKGRVKIRLACSGSAACGGRVTVRSRAKIRVSGKRRSVVFINKQTGSIAAGSARTITFKVRSLGRRALRSHSRIGVKISVRVPSTGLPALTNTRNVTLRR